MAEKTMVSDFVSRIKHEVKEAEQAASYFFEYARDMEEEAKVIAYSFMPAAFRIKYEYDIERGEEIFTNTNKWGRTSLFDLIDQMEEWAEANKDAELKGDGDEIKKIEASILAEIAEAKAAAIRDENKEEE